MWRVPLVAATILVLELAFIRLIPAEVRAISYFTNLLLMSAFFGLGLGCILQKKRDLSFLLPVGALLVLVFVWYGRGIVIHEDASQVHYWLQYAEIKGEAPRLPLFPAAALIFILGSMPFVALGQKLAREMDRLPRLVAYGLDILGSLIGTLVFVLSSFLSLPPWIWPPILLTLLAVAFVRSRIKQIFFAAAGCCFLLLHVSPYPAQWSPYYYVQYNVEQAGTRVWSNSAFIQFAVNFASDDVEFRGFRQYLLQKWSLPYSKYRADHQNLPPRKVLILGAGTGNDVFVALQNGAQEIVAVEIDPVILSLGKTRNPTNPYGDTRVTTIIDDARHYMRTSRDRFDMIVFGTVDSVTLLGTQANLRLENYVHTVESLDDAKRLLNDDGMVTLYYSALKDWIRARMLSTLRASFGPESQIHVYANGLLFDTVLMGYKDKSDHQSEASEVIPSTDDWPFMYLQYPTIAPVYLKLMAFVAVMTFLVFLVLRKVHHSKGFHANFLFLGLGFTLMESSAIVRLALVFGSTWTINAVVFSSVLLTIFVANVMVLRRRAPSITFAWAGLFSCILINYLFPVSWFFDVTTSVRVALCGVLIGAPVFFAAVAFSRLFDREQVTGYPLGINLIGAMVGGMIEYLSMLIGMRSVWLIIFAVYLLAFLSTRLVDRKRAQPA